MHKKGWFMHQVTRAKLPVSQPDQQRRIVAYLDAVQAHTAELQRTAAALAADLDQTEQAILAQAFKGKL